MRKDGVCGGCGKGKPVSDTKILIEVLERQERVKRAIEMREALVALCRYVLDSQGVEA
jgi:hypothetical protein